jgi:hypothetical protein
VALGAGAAGVVAGLAVTIPGGACAAPSSTMIGSSSSTPQVSSPLCTPATFGPAHQRVEAALSARVTQRNARAAGADNTANHHVPAPRRAAHSMVFTYRVDVVMTPHTHLTAVIDDEIYIEGVLANLEPVIAAAIQSAEGNGKRWRRGPPSRTPRARWPRPRVTPTGRPRSSPHRRRTASPGTVRSS